MAKALRKMQSRRDLRRTQWEQLHSSQRGGTKCPGSMKKKAKSAGKHEGR